MRSWHQQLTCENAMSFCSMAAKPWSKPIKPRSGTLQSRFAELATPLPTQQLTAMKASLFGVAGGLLSAVSAAGTSSFSPARPPAIPLAVKSPYLNVWLPGGSDGGDGGYLAGETTTHWT